MTRTEEIVKHLSVYDGKRQDKFISGSMLGNDVLQNFLMIKHDIQEDFVLGQNSIGSVFHKGMQAGANELFGSDIVDTEVKVSKKLSNGWTVTGTIDVVDHENREITDYKLSKNYALKMVKKEPRHGYRLQLNAYKWCSDLDYKMFLEFFMKDQNMLKSEPAYEHYEIADIESLEQEMILITDELDAYLKEDKTPPECDTWLRKSNGSLIKSRCAMYCSASSVCPYYSERQSINDSINTIAGW